MSPQPSDELADVVARWMEDEAELRARGDTQATVPGALDRVVGDAAAQLVALRRAEARLTAPLTEPPRPPNPPGLLVFRRAADADVEPLTALIRRAYAPLAARNLRFVATHQGPAITRRRLATGEGWVGQLDGAVVATVTLVPPDVDGGGAPWFGRPGIAKFAQLAVDPQHKGRGLGGELMDFVERRSVALGAAELALDTAVPATDLRAMYRARGYRHVAWCDYRPDTNYPSVVMSKVLGPAW